MTIQSTTTKTSAIALMTGLLLAAGCGGGEGADTEMDAASNAATVSAAPMGDNDEGERVYGSVCITCHQADGNGLEGAFPPLAGSAVATGDPEMPIMIVLSGLTGQMTRGGVTYNGMMTPWGSTLSDAEVAAVLTYVRTNFGNSAEEVTEAQVTEVRAATASQMAPHTTDELEIVEIVSE